MSTSTKTMIQAILTKNEKLEPGQYKIGKKIIFDNDRFYAAAELYEGQYIPPGEEKPQDVIIQIFRKGDDCFKPFNPFMNALNSNPDARPYQVLPIATDQKQGAMIYQRSDHGVYLNDLLLDITTIEQRKELPPPHILMRILLDIAKGVRLEQQGDKIPANYIYTVSISPIKGMRIGTLSTYRGFANPKAILLQGTEKLKESLRKLSKDIPIKEDKTWMEYVLLDLLDPNTILARTSEILSTTQMESPYLAATLRPPESLDEEINNTETDVYRLGTLAWQTWMLSNLYSADLTDIMNMFHRKMKPKDQELGKRFEQRVIKDASEVFLNLLKECTSKVPGDRPPIDKVIEVLSIEYHRYREEYIKKNKLEDILKNINDAKGGKETKMLREEAQVEGQPREQALLQKEGEQKVLAETSPPGGLSFMQSTPPPPGGLSFSQPTPQPEVRFQIAKNPSPLASPAPSQTSEGEPSTQEDSDSQPGMPRHK